MNTDIKKLHSLGKIQVNRLAREIVWGSMFYSDYENRYGIDREIVSDYADGYIEWLAEEFNTTDEDWGIHGKAWDDIVFKYYCDHKSGYSFYDYIQYMVCID